MMNYIETSALLVRLYADYKHYYGSDDPDYAAYAEAVARAISALAQCEGEE